jgi:hypothetical protein
VGGSQRPSADAALLMDDDTTPFFDFPKQPLQKMMRTAMADDPWLVRRAGLKHGVVAGSLALSTPLQP